MAIKKKPARKEKPDESIHVRLDNPMMIRKENLSLAIDIIGLLKRYYEYLETKKQKDDIMRLLRADVAEIKRIARELDVEELPVSAGELMGMKTIEKHDKIELKAKMNALKSEEERREEKRREELTVVKAQLPKAKKEPIRLQPRDKLETELEELKNLISRM